MGVGRAVFRADSYARADFDGNSAAVGNFVRGISERADYYGTNLGNGESLPRRNVDVWEKSDDSRGLEMDSTKLSLF